MNKSPILAVLAILALAAGAAAYGLYNHPPHCDACHSQPYANYSGSLVGLLSGPAAGSCNTASAECVWSHQILTDGQAWLQCQNCHSAIYSSIMSSVHSSLQGTYGCACHAVMHVGYGTPTAGYAACIYYYKPSTNAPAAVAAGSFTPTSLCFYGTPGGTYYFFNGTPMTTPPQALAVTPGYIANATAGTVKILPGRGSEYSGDVFQVLTWTLAAYNAPPAPYEHALTEEQPNGETIIVGVYDIHTGTFILVRPWGPYNSFRYTSPYEEPGWAACFNCHFIYQGQPTAFSVAKIDGVWKIGIPEDVFKSLTDPHNIQVPAAAVEAKPVFNMAAAGAAAVVVLLAGAILALKRR
ncbi:MAG: hypothetical protein QXP98_07715 [Thermoproteus sp.]